MCNPVKRCVYLGRALSVGSIISIKLSLKSIFSRLEPPQLDQGKKFSKERQPGSALGALINSAFVTVITGLLGFGSTAGLKSFKKFEKI